MTDVVGRGDYDVGVDTSRMGAGLTDAEAKLKASGDRTASGISNSLSAGFKAAAGAVGVIGVAVSAVGIDSAIKWESAFAGVRKTVDTSKEGFDQLEATIRSMAGEIPLTAVELAGLAETAGALGIEAENIAEFVRVTAMIGTTTDVSADQAATSLGQLSNVLGLTQDDYEKFGSALVDLGNKGASTESQILEIASRAGAAGHLIGLATPDILGFASAVANTGVEAEVGGSSLQKFYLGTQTLVNSGKIDQLVQLLGMSADEIRAMWQADPSGLLQSIVASWGDLDSATRQRSIQQMFGDEIRMTKTLLNLAGNVDNVTASVNTGRDAWQENAAMQTEFGKRAETTESQMKMLQNDLNEVAITIGEALLPHVKNFVALARDVAQGVANWMKENKGLVDTLIPLLSVLAGILALKWGGNFVQALLGQLGLRGLGQLLAKSIIPQATIAGTAAGGAQATAHTTAATGQGFITQMIAGYGTMVTKLNASTSLAGRALGLVMGKGVIAGIAVGIGTLIVSEIAKAVDPHREEINRAIFGETEAQFSEQGGAAAGTFIDSVVDGFHAGADDITGFFNANLPAWALGFGEGGEEAARAWQDAFIQAQALGFGGAEASRIAEGFKLEYLKALREGLDPEAARQRASEALAGLLMGLTPGAADTNLLIEQWASSGRLAGEAGGEAAADAAVTSAGLGEPDFGQRMAGSGSMEAYLEQQFEHAGEAAGEAFTPPIEDAFAGLGELARAHIPTLTAAFEAFGPAFDIPPAMAEVMAQRMGITADDVVQIFDTLATESADRVSWFKEVLAALPPEFDKTGDEARVLAETFNLTSREMEEVFGGAVDSIKADVNAMGDALGGMVKSSDSAWKSFKTSTKDGQVDIEDRIKKLQGRLTTLNEVELAKLGPAALANWLAARQATQQELGQLTFYVDNKTDILANFMPDRLDASQPDILAEWRKIFGITEGAVDDITDETETGADDTADAFPDALHGRQGELRHEVNVMGNTLNDLDISDDARRWGDNVGDAFILGLSRALAAGRDKVAGSIPTGPLKNASPPKEGPLKDIIRWGVRSADLYVKAFSFRLRTGGRDIARSLAHWNMQPKFDLDKLNGIQRGEMQRAMAFDGPGVAFGRDVDRFVFNIRIGHLYGGDAGLNQLRRELERVAIHWNRLGAVRAGRA